MNFYRKNMKMKHLIETSVAEQAKIIAEQAKWVTVSRRLFYG